MTPTPEQIQRIYRILAEALVLRRVSPSAVASIALYGGFGKAIRADMERFDAIARV